MISGFLAAITIPLMGMLLQLDSGFKLQENRLLATRPGLAFDRSSLAHFPSRFEAYFNDHFGFRRRMIHWLSLAKVFGLGVSSSPSVVLGRDGWLFFGDIEIDYHRAVKPFTDQQLHDWRTWFEQRRDWLAQRGIKFLVVVAPNKSSIYPEFMPAAYNRVRTESRLDQLLAELKMNSNLEVVDLRESLVKAKAESPVYYRTDSHWNPRGAYIGYSQIVKSLSRHFPGMKAMAPDAFRDVAETSPGRDLAALLGLQTSYQENVVEMEPREPRKARKVETVEAGKGPGGQVIKAKDVYEHPEASLPRAVVFRDSFGTWLMPFLSEHFSRLVLSWEYTLDRDIVERERPQVVIQEVVERMLVVDNPTWIQN